MLVLRVGSIRSHLTADKHFPVNQRAITCSPKMSLLLEVKSTPALIIKPTLILVTHTDDLGWYITSNQQGLVLNQLIATGDSCEVKGCDSKTVCRS